MPELTTTSVVWPAIDTLPRNATGCLYYRLQTGQTYAEDLAFPTTQPTAA